MLRIINYRMLEKRHRYVPEANHNNMMTRNEILAVVSNSSKIGI